MTMGERIKQLRKSACLTQSELGEKVGVKKNAVSKWECGRVENIPLSTVRELASLFGVSVTYLTEDKTTELELTKEQLEKLKPATQEGQSSYALKGLNNKLFHPTMVKSTVEEIDEEALDFSAWILHDLGWLTQQGMLEEALSRIQYYAELDPEAFLKACANGLTVIRWFLDNNISIEHK